MRIGEAACCRGVTVETFRRWHRDGRLRAKSRTAGGHRRDDAGEVASLAGDRPAGHRARKTLAYARVSSHDQKADRVRQASRLHDHGLSSGFQNIGVIQASEAA